MTITPFARLSRLITAVAVLSLLFAFNIAAQKKKPAPSNTQKAAAKSADKQTIAARSNANKPTVNQQAAAKETAARRAEKDRQIAAARQAVEAHRQAALAEQRRREQIRREAAALIERGFRTETVNNIGNDNVEGEDLKIRRVAVEALGTRAGTVVVMESKTGKVLTIVNQDWAIRKGFKPCSTIKLVSAVAGVNENLIREDGSLTKQSIGVKLDDAIARSNNLYFQKVGANLGNQKMISYARALGLGEPTGINAEGETAGKLPYNNNNARIYSHGDDFEVTPLQLAVLVTAIANGGKLVVPNTPRTKIEKANFHPQPRREANLPTETLTSLHAGMRGATQYGTAGRAGIANLHAAGKTGSCVMGNSWVGLFTSVAPVENPEYTIVVITRGQGERGKYAAQVAGVIYRALKSRIDKNPTEFLATKTPPKVKPNHQNNAALQNEDEGADETADDAANQFVETNPKKGGRRDIEKEVIVVGASDEREEDVKFAPVVAVKKPPLPAKITSPLFPPIIIENRRGETEEPPAEQPKPSRPRVVRSNP